MSISTTVENIRGFLFLSKTGLHAVHGTLWTELTFYTYSLPPYRFLIECVLHCLAKWPLYSYMDIYVRNVNASRLILFEMRNGIIGQAIILF